MPATMQAKDLDVIAILEEIRRINDGEGATIPHAYWAPHEARWAQSREIAEKEGVPFKVMLAKLRRLIDAGLITGCACGCRGDLEITAPGRERLHMSPVEGWARRAYRIFHFFNTAGLSLLERRTGLCPACEKHHARKV